MLAEDLMKLSTSPTLQAIGIGAMILFFGFRLLTGVNRESPFSPYALQVFALIIILPVILTLALMDKFPIEAITGLLGTIVGFFFGGAAGGRGQGGGQGGAGGQSQ